MLYLPLQSKVAVRLCKCVILSTDILKLKLWKMDFDTIFKMMFALVQGYLYLLTYLLTYLISRRCWLFAAFYSCDALHKHSQFPVERCLPVRLSVRPSVTTRYCIKTV